MGKIVAIGGGAIGAKGRPVETTEIDQEIMRLSGKTTPRLLYVPTAGGDSETYCEAVRSHFGERLGCEVDTLCLITSKPSEKEIEDKIFSSDIIYVGGGNTLKMMIAWRRLGVDKVLEEAYRRSIVLSGLSAGAICWFRYGSSNSRKKANPDAELIKISGLRFINTLCCPHYDVEEDRRPHLKELMEKTPGVAIALANCCAIEMLDDTYRIISSKSNANAYKVFYRRGEFYEERIEQKKEFSPIENLLLKY
jgi:dipeptidase E